LLTTLLLVPLVLPFCIYGVAARVLVVKLDRDVLSRRLWRVIAAVGVLVAFNYVAVLIERHHW
jgi:hypothetical protein